MATDGDYTSFSDLFKLGREILKTDTFVLHEAQTWASPAKNALVKCLFIFGLSKAERALVADDVRTFRKAKHSCILALQDVISEAEVRQSRADTLGTGRVGVDLHWFNWRESLTLFFIRQFRRRNQPLFPIDMNNYAVYRGK